MTLPKDFKEFIELLNKNQVEYVLVGGWAVAYHGNPRFTGAIDFLVNTTKGNSQRLAAALVQFGFPEGSVKGELFLEPEKVIQIGYPPLRIDLVTSIDGVRWDEAWENKTVVEVDDTFMYLIGFDDLKRNKASTGRAKDLADLEALEG